MINAESSFMGDLLGSMNSIEDGTANVDLTNSTNETRSLLEDLSGLGLSYGNLLNPEDAPMPQYQAHNESDMLYEHQDDWEAAERLANHYANVPGEYVFEEPEQSFIAQPNSKPMLQSHPKINWELVEGILQGTKSTKVYSIKSNHSGQVIMDGMLMFEAAKTIQNLLNEGRNFSDIKVLGIISSGIQYSSVVMEALRSVKKRHAVLKESRYDEAKDLDVIISEKKVEAQRLKERVIAFLVDEGYITK